MLQWRWLYFINLGREKMWTKTGPIKKEARASIKAVYLPSSFVKTLSNIFFLHSRHLSEQSGWTNATALLIYILNWKKWKLWMLLCVFNAYFFSFVHSFVCSFIRKLHPKNLFNGQKETSQNLSVAHTQTAAFRLLYAFAWCNVSICMRFYFGNIFGLNCLNVLR